MTRTLPYTWRRTFRAPAATRQRAGVVSTTNRHRHTRTHRPKTGPTNKKRGFRLSTAPSYNRQSRRTRRCGEHTVMSVILLTSILPPDPLLPHYHHHPPCIPAFDTIELEIEQQAGDGTARPEENRRRGPNGTSVKQEAPSTITMQTSGPLDRSMTQPLNPRHPPT